MTKTEAFQISMLEGKPINHRFMSEDEYIQILSPSKLKDEEGRIFHLHEFMAYRQRPEWENDWSIYQ